MKERVREKSSEGRKDLRRDWKKEDWRKEELEEGRTGGRNGLGVKGRVGEKGSGGRKGLRKDGLKERLEERRTGGKRVGRRQELSHSTKCTRMGWSPGIRADAYFSDPVLLVLRHPFYTA